MPEGYLIDLQVCRRCVYLWFRCGRRILKIRREYSPEVYLKPGDLDRLGEVYFTEDICEADRVVKKFFPRGSREFIELKFRDTEYYSRFIEYAEAKRVTLFNSDLLHSQKFIFKTDLKPLTEVYIKDFQPVGDELDPEPPPLNVMFIDLDVKINRNSEVVEGFTVKHEGYTECLTDDEDKVLGELSRIIGRHDPDVLVVNMGAEDFLKTVYSRAKIYFKKYSLGRIEDSNGWRFTAQGRIVVSVDYYLEYGLEGLQERCIFSMLPPQTAYLWTAGRLVDSRQCYVAYRKGFAIPPSENLNLVVRTAWELFKADKGGVLQTPVAGLHENVAVLDFESMFPNIIVGFNVSYETVSTDGVRKEPRGLLVDVVEPFLKRRLYFKHMAKRSVEPVRSWADRRQSELKLLLVSSYGYSGNSFNRFGNPLTFEWINRISREVMIKVYGICRKLGFKVIYSDTDSIFVKKKDAEVEEFRRLAEILSRETGLPIKIDRVYKFLVLMDQIYGGKRYYGRLIDGTIDVKGIECVRRDYPEYIKEFQLKLIDKLLSGEGKEDVYRNYRGCLTMIANAIDEINEGRVPVEKLIIRKILRRKEYRVLAPHYIASLQLKMHGIPVTTGDIVEFIYIDSGNRNPFRRVVAKQLYGGGEYDREKYIELLLDAAEILNVFGFKRSRFYQNGKDYIDNIFEEEYLFLNDNHG